MKARGFTREESDSESTQRGVGSSDSAARFRCPPLPGSDVHLLPALYCKSCTLLRTQGPPYARHTQTSLSTKTQRKSRNQSQPSERRAKASPPIRNPLPSRPFFSHSHFLSRTDESFIAPRSEATASLCQAVHRSPCAAIVMRTGRSSASAAAVAFHHSPLSRLHLLSSGDVRQHR
jgi:hypothetical protein